MALLGVTATGLVALTVGALAAPLGLASSLGAGAALVPDCGDLSLVRPSYVLVAGGVTSVTLDGVPAGCVGTRLQVALVSTAGTALATGGPVTATGTTVVVTGLSAAPAPGAVATVHVSAVGP